MSAEVIPFPSEKRRCWGCEHSIDGASGTYCRMFQEEILLETVAEDCEEFEPEA